MISGWRYYNHALLPDCAPHEIPDITGMNSREFWTNRSGLAALARWTSNYDCDTQKNWWYIVKDDLFDISALKAKRRYEINKGKKNFRVEVINPRQYIKELVDIHIKAYEKYPVQYRPKLDRNEFAKEIVSWTGNIKVFGAFSLESSKLCGFAMIIEAAAYANFSRLKVMPSEERKGINAALVAGMLEAYNDRLESGYYICDGERALFHETQFQDYLEKYFGFRKAYSRLHVRFRFPFSLAIALLEPFRPIIAKLNGSVMKKLNVLLLFKELSQ